MSIVHWKSPVSGSFEDAQSWDTGTPPGVNDDVFLTYLTSVQVPYTVTSFPTVLEEIHSLTIAAGVTLDVSGPANFNPLAIPGLLIDSFSNAGTMDVLGGSLEGRVEFFGQFNNTGLLEISGAAGGQPNGAWTNIGTIEVLDGGSFGLN
jgi:hypothetical protein